MTLYAAIWALGRMDKKAALEALNTIDTYRAPVVKNIQRAALVKANDWAAVAYEEGLIHEELLTLYKASAYDELSQKIIERLPNLHPENSQYIYAFYLLSNHQKELRPHVHIWLACFPLKPNYWKILRAIFKAAEMLDDLPTLALIATKIEGGKPYFTIPSWYNKVWGCANIRV